MKITHNIRSITGKTYSVKKYEYDNSILHVYFSDRVEETEYSNVILVFNDNKVELVRFLGRYLNDIRNVSYEEFLIIINGIKGDGGLFAYFGVRAENRLVFLGL